MNSHTNPRINPHHKPFSQEREKRENGVGSSSIFSAGSQGNKLDGAESASSIDGRNPGLHELQRIFLSGISTRSDSQNTLNNSAIGETIDLGKKETTTWMKDAPSDSDITNAPVENDTFSRGPALERRERLPSSCSALIRPDSDAAWHGEGSHLKNPRATALSESNKQSTFWQNAKEISRFCELLESGPLKKLPPMVLHQPRGNGAPYWNDGNTRSSRCSLLAPISTRPSSVTKLTGIQRRRCKTTGVPIVSKTCEPQRVRRNSAASTVPDKFERKKKLKEWTEEGGLVFDEAYISEYWKRSEKRESTTRRSRGPREEKASSPDVSISIMSDRSRNTHPPEKKTSARSRDWPLTSGLSSPAARAVGGRIVVVSNCFGDIAALNNAATTTGASSIIHIGELGVLSPHSISRYSVDVIRGIVSKSPLVPEQERKVLAPAAAEQIRRWATLNASKFSQALDYSPDHTFRFKVPVFAVHGVHEDVSMLMEFQRKTVLRRIKLVGAETSKTPVAVLDNGMQVRLFGIGGQLQMERLFNHGDGSSEYAGVREGRCWASIESISNIIETGSKIAKDENELRLLCVSSLGDGTMSGTVHSRTFLLQLALAIEADYLIIASLKPWVKPVMVNELHYAVESDMLASFWERFERAEEKFCPVFETVRKATYQDAARRKAVEAVRRVLGLRPPVRRPVEKAGRVTGGGTGKFPSTVVLSGALDTRLILNAAHGSTVKVVLESGGGSRVRQGEANQSPGWD